MNIEENITRKINLIDNDGLSAYSNHAAQQSHNAFRVFYNFIKETKPSQIVEIGTALGGFTAFLKLVCNELNLNTYILSYDIYSKPWYDDIIKMGVDVRVEDIFTNTDYGVQSHAIDSIKKPGTSIVLCDGGNKINEFNIFSNFLKNNDFILAHDYAKDRTTFDSYINRKIWNWLEIQDSDISAACISNNLMDYNQEIFNSVAWVCKQKQ